MYLSNLKLWNFRKFGSNSSIDLENPNLDLNFTKGINVLIGENDSGKSAIVDSIKLTLKTHSYEWFRLDWDDFYDGSDRLRIELRFENLSDDEAKNFTEWLGWIGEGDEAKPFLRLIYDASRNLNNQYIYPTEIRAGVDETGYQLTAEAREYLKTTYLKPLRDAKSELIPRKNSRLTQILQGHEAFKGKDQDHLLVGLFQDFNNHVAKYFEGTDKDGVVLTGENVKGKELKNEIDKFIQAFYSKDKESYFGVLGNSLKNILERLELSIKDELNPGLGTLNRLFMASELLHLQKKNWSGLRLGLIEELEAHLHPQAQMQIIEALQNEENIQLILTTHSPNLASKLKLENLIICNDNNAFPMGAAYTKLDSDNYKFLEKFLDTTKANLFFAKGVILVEGWAEEILIPSIAKAIGINLTEKGISIVNIGNTGFDHYSKIYLRKEEPFMKIPVAVITDSDIREYEKEGDDFVKRVENTVRVETQGVIDSNNVKSEQSIKYYTAPNWTLEYSLFKSNSLTSTLQSVCKSIHSRTNWDTDFEKTLAIKLIDKNKKLRKTEVAYRLATTIDEDLQKAPDERTIVIDINNDESIKYLIQAIRYAARN
ncbi:AAA family ATPase [Tenacibaculum sp. 1_MG-2023]|uniref:ATP-dependent nuclease n=1 Tax=Tenacibaculum sp. 1_MG-2023 TaxID=3062653 RepID=UPI0026E3326F|nr:AAA family ATPase [Tenacibaculum sp. 1_MG-2023]MDO6675050.1 AAA family ATPase [Tenacibaculum sp. 1_MG-2023]